MEYRRLGRSGLDVSVVCLGTMMFGDRTDAAAAHEIVAHARDHGVNFIDTADAYAGGASERIAGAAIRAHRDHWVLATKAGNALDPKLRNNGGLSRRWLMQACDGSLARLGADWIDVYYLHYDDFATPLDETVAAVGDLIRAGKIRHFGVSNFRGWRIAEVMRLCAQLGVPRPIVCQPYYNLLNRMPEVEILPACDHYGLGVAPYSPIARGVLTGKYGAGSPPPDSRVGRRDARMMETEFREESIAVARRLQEHAAASGRPLAHFALAWLWANRIVSSVIAGPRTLAQWQDYVAAVGTRWSDEDEALVDSLVRPGHPSTPGYSDPRYPFFGRRLA
ncbi:MAG: aldo/keto reductase [Burkholderiales bacterium]|nr:aldo/keto reductase [Burkholderiales bacterium]GIK85917.1 MAG: oxidoreductase [Betaproteobacteria bacterium]